MAEPDATRDAILTRARARYGIPYQIDPVPTWDTTTDCSLYVREVYREAGLSWPSGVRTAEHERQATVPIGWDEVLPGDLIFFEDTYDAAGPAGPDGRIASHIGISHGAGTLRMSDANDGRGNSGETNIGTHYWQAHLLEPRRHPALVGATAPPPVTTDQMPRGIDVASYQGDPDWAQVAASGVAFAITKVTEGTTYVNPTAARNWREIQAGSMVRGGYHFARPNTTRTNARAEAQYFLDNLERIGGVVSGDLLCLDLESGTGDLGPWALEWLRVVEERTRIVPLVYTGAWFSVPHGLGNYPELARHPLWLAAYQATMPPPTPPWSKVSIWQHSDEGSIPGIAGPVDLNWFNGTLAELRALGQIGGVPPADPFAPWRDKVGSGILEMMAADGTVPVMASTWLPLGRGAADAEAEEGYGENGTRYLYHLPSNRSWRYRAA